MGLHDYGEILARQAAEILKKAREIGQGGRGEVGRGGRGEVGRAPALVGQAGVDGRQVAMKQPVERTDPRLFDLLAAESRDELRRRVARHAPERPSSERDVRVEIAALQAVKLQDIQEFHRAFFGAQNAQASVVGDFDPKEIKSLLTELFGGWKSAKPYARLASSLVSRALCATSRRRRISRRTLSLRPSSSGPSTASRAIQGRG